MPVSIVKSARDYLLSFDGIDDQKIDLQLTGWKGKKNKSHSGIYRSFLEHAKNRQSMPNTIGDVDKLKDVLFDFNSRKVISEYTDHFGLLNAIKKAKIRTPAPIDASNNRSHWVIYAKSAISSAKFISSFKDADSFHEFVESFYKNEYSRLALPLLLKEEIIGFGFALSCDFLKENGYSGFVKPDTHINDICRGVGITTATTDFGVFKDVIAYCVKHDLVPYEFDKLIWLVGSGNFYKSEIQITVRKADFIKKVLNGG